MASGATSTQPVCPERGGKANSQMFPKEQQLFNEALALRRDNSQFPGAGRIFSSATHY